MKILITGGTGFLGRHLCSLLSNAGHELTILARSDTNQQGPSSSIRVLRGDPTERGDWWVSLAEHDAVINLAGASIFQRWTKKTKKQILESRILSTRNIVRALKDTGRRDIVLLNASGIGYYGHCGDEIVVETSPGGNTYLASVAELWERAAREAEDTGIRVVLCRFGIVLGRNGGALPRVISLFRHHLGAMWGTGRQWFSWIHEDDVAGVISFLLTHDEINGAVNLTAPFPVTNLEMTGTLNMLLDTKAVVGRLPEWFFRLILGVFADVFLKGQRVIPDVLLRNSFAFRYPTFNEALTDLMK